MARQQSSGSRNFCNTCYYFGMDFSVYVCQFFNFVIDLGEHLLIEPFCLGVCPDLPRLGGFLYSAAVSSDSGKI